MNKEDFYTHLYSGEYPELWALKYMNKPPELIHALEVDLRQVETRLAAYYAAMEEYQALRKPGKTMITMNDQLKQMYNGIRMNQEPKLTELAKICKDRYGEKGFDHRRLLNSCTTFETQGTITGRFYSDTPAF